MLNKIISKALIICLLVISSSAFASNHTLYSIFLIPDKNAETYIRSFNSHVAEQGIYEKYSITPFIEDYPATITLYSANFKYFYLESIVELLKRIANSSEEFEVSTNQIIVDDNGYVTLNISGEHNLQSVFNTVIRHLAKDSYKDSTVPSWMNFSPMKKKAFQKGNSSIKFDQFTPSISITAKDLYTDTIKQMFEDDFNKTIQSFDQKPSNFKVIGIGLGYADKNGQIEEVIKMYNFGETKGYSFEETT